PRSGHGSQPHAPSDGALLPWSQSMSSLQATANAKNRPYLERVRRPAHPSCEGAPDSPMLSRSDARAEPSTRPQARRTGLYRPARATAPAGFDATLVRTEVRSAIHRGARLTSVPQAREVSTRRNTAKRPNLARDGKHIGNSRETT